MTARTEFSPPGEDRTRLTPEGITFGDRIFTEPRRFPRLGASLLVPAQQGLYVILTPDDRCGPRPFAVLYIGEAANLQQRLTADHEKYPEWMRKADGQVFFAWHRTPGLTYQQRRDAEQQLIAELHPPCNVRLDARASLRALCWTRTPTRRIQ